MSLIIVPFKTVSSANFSWYCVKEVTREGTLYTRLVAVAGATGGVTRVRVAGIPATVNLENWLSPSPFTVRRAPPPKLDSTTGTSRTGGAVWVIVR